jgi:hypothetical protein
MRVRVTSVAILVSAAAAIAASQVASSPSSPVPVIVHEWGTFTSIAGENGQAVEWLPQGGVSDLPCFVERSNLNIKSFLAGTVRMETPVLYFYAQENATVSVNVGFRQGIITEWYPHAAVNAGSWPWSRSEGTLGWNSVKVSPGVAAEFPVEPAPSHYYQARQTDAVPLQVGSQWEGFLFYRGVGQFQPPISATVGADGRAVVWSTPEAAVGDVILFENRNGVVAYSVQHGSGGTLTLDRPALDDESTAPKKELVNLLLANGLYRKEAEAMVATWSDSWFEEGTRLFYIVPRAAVDAIVPLKIAPAPAAVERVFVGRMELVTPAIKQDVARALVANDRTTLEKYGRFIAPIGERVLAESAPAERALLDGRLRAISSAWMTPSSSCRQ